jgi:alpha/beta superfamily hydrolase
VSCRGASGSKGRTSWTGKPEREDYISVVGFLVHYMDSVEELDHESPPESPRPEEPILVVLGGYSYGSLIASHLPNPCEILKTFSTCEEGTAAAEIKSRAASLAGQRNEEIRVLGAARIHHRKSSHKHRHTLLVGGEETTPEKRRRSTETRRSTDIRMSLDIPRTLSQFRRKSYESKQPSTPPKPVHLEHSLPKIEPAYLLVSPLLTPISTFTAWSLKQDTEEQCVRFSKNPSLAVFGDDDFFTSAKTLRRWSQFIGSRPASRFRCVEIKGAGHFWHDRDTQIQLKKAVKDWLKEISKVQPVASILQEG